MSDFVWWRDGVVYQIYPRSFADSNGDGFGDLPGIISRLDHLRGAPDSLGVDAIWLAPFYPSPDFDHGYDISDFETIDPRFGTMEDFETLIARAHERGIKVVIDLVLNHTSDQHRWFKESRSGKENARRDWYLWAPPSSGNRPPNRWKSIFGGSAWESDQETGEYYYHAFMKEQPDLNWRNPELRARMFRMIRFWLKKGVDGFRLDAFNACFKGSLLRENPVKLGVRPYDCQRHVYDLDRPEMRDLLRELRGILDEEDGRIAVGEPVGNDPDIAVRYLGNGTDQLHLVFNFQFLRQPWKPRAFQNAIRTWDALVHPNAWPCYVLSNHDVSRHATRFGSGPESDARAKVAAALLLTLRGTPFLYAGEEIGMQDAQIPFIEVQDFLGRQYWPFFKGRDPARAPLQWDSSPNAGFTTGDPWIRINDDFSRRNVAAQKADDNSVFHFYRRLIALRRESVALRRGRWLPMIAHPDHVLAYLREDREQTMLVALNFSNKRRRRNLCSALPPYRWRLRLSSASSNHERIRGTDTNITLMPHEACILERA